MLTSKFRLEISFKNNHQARALIQFVVRIQKLKWSRFCRNYSHVLYWVRYLCQLYCKIPDSHIFRLLSSILVIISTNQLIDEIMPSYSWSCFPKARDGRISFPFIYSASRICMENDCQIDCKSSVCMPPIKRADSKCNERRKQTIIASYCQSVTSVANKSTKHLQKIRVISKIGLEFLIDLVWNGCYVWYHIPIRVWIENQLMWFKRSHALHIVV